MMRSSGSSRTTTRGPRKKEQDLLTDPNVLADPARVAEVATGVQALLDFKAWLRATFVCDTFTTPDELGRKIAVALAKYSPKQAPRAAPPAPKQGEIRIVHALQPAPHFHGRDSLLTHLGLPARAPPRSPARSFKWLIPARNPSHPVQLPEPTASFGCHSPERQNPPGSPRIRASRTAEGPGTSRILDPTDRVIDNPQVHRYSSSR
jgi:hypothetical protein